MKKFGEIAFYVAVGIVLIVLIAAQAHMEWVKYQAAQQILENAESSRQYQNAHP